MDDVQHADDRPPWSRRIRSERKARNWSQHDAITALRTHASSPLPTNNSLLRNWKRWESGEAEPDDFYKPLIAKTFGTVTQAFFPQEHSRSRDSDLLISTGLDTLEIMARLRLSDISSGTLEALQIATNQLCSEYPYLDSDQLYTKSKAWLRRITSLLDQRLTLSQHREVLTLAGWNTLLIGCIAHDMGNRRHAEAARQAAFSLGKESDNVEIMAWSQEMRAWFALTARDYRGVVAAVETGVSLAPNQSAAVQLAAQGAKAWARLGDRQQAEASLDNGRNLLERLPYPENLDHHFVVDPSKFDFYAMDCYQILNENDLSRVYATEVIKASTDPDGTERKPMRIAEAHITLGIVAARANNLDEAVSYGRQALATNRRSLPSLLHYAQELKDVLGRQYPGQPEASAFIDELESLSRISRS